MKQTWTISISQEHTNNSFMPRAKYKHKNVVCLDILCSQFYKITIASTRRLHAMFAIQNIDFKFYYLYTVKSPNAHTYIAIFITVLNKCFNK